jgi:DNA-directed RNA polymerase subunit RPC12/RpoP
VKKKFWLALGFLVALVAIAYARPGGGDSYSGGGGHGGGGGGGIDDVIAFIELIYYLVRLVIEVPWLGIPLVIGIVVWFAWSAIKARLNKDWDSGPPVELEKAVGLEPIRDVDPEFSPVVFEDFAFRLFSAAVRDPDSVAPYVSERPRESIRSRKHVVEQAIVGAMRVYDVKVGGKRITVSIEFEANTLTKDGTYYSVERWQLGRDAGVKSKPPAATRTFPCPNCGAPWQANATGTQVCAYCNQVVDNGRFDWVVESITVASVDQRPPTLTTEVRERGTDLPTYKQSDADERARKIDLDLGAFRARLELVYHELNKAWSSNDLTPVRGFVSDGLFDYLQYWVDAYKRQGLRNVLKDMRIVRSELAKVTRDRWYHSVTMRIWGRGKDYVVRTSDGRRIKGAKKKDRNYSEYWTFIRSADRNKQPVNTEPKCGNCGAPLDITMAGACKHCGAHVTAGEFDWVLSKIEQDDSYRG